jgi:hypothetical protein
MTKQSLVDKKDLAKEVISFTFGLISTAIGFFLALYFNNNIEINKEIETFANIKKGVVAEIKQNRQTLDSSFYKYFDGVIFNDLSIVSSNQQLINDIFLKYATPDLLIAMQNYIRKCELCNKQKNQLKDFRIAGGKEEWEYVLENSLANTLKETEKSIQELNAQLSNR